MCAANIEAATTTLAPAPGNLSLSSATYSVNENAGTVTITVNRTGGTTGTVTVNYATSFGTAGPPDFTATSGTLTFPNGVAVQSFTVPILNDVVSETPETFTVTLSNPTGGSALVPPTSAVVTIIDDDTGVDLGITKSGPATVTPAGNIDYTITVTNGGPATATNVTVTDTLPAGTTFVSANPSQGTCSGTTTVTCSLGSLTIFGPATVLLRIKAPATGSVSNTASVSATEVDSNATNNASTASTAIAGPIPALSPFALLLLGAVLGTTGFMFMKR